MSTNYLTVHVYMSINGPSKECLSKTNHQESNWSQIFRWITTVNFNEKCITKRCLRPEPDILTFFWLPKWWSNKKPRMSSKEYTTLEIQKNIYTWMLNMKNIYHLCKIWKLWRKYDFFPETFITNCWGW